MNHPDRTAAPAAPAGPGPRPARAAGPALVALALAAGCTGALALAVDMYAIGNWSGGNCILGNTDADRGAWPGMVAAWYDRMGQLGHEKAGQWVDGNMTVQRFCDPSWNAACADTQYVDWPAAAIVAAHGWNAGDRWAALMRNAWKGACSTAMGAGGSMLVGDAKLKFLHASSCLSLNDSYFGSLAVAMRKPGSAKGLHLMTGFHGWMWIGPDYAQDYRDTASHGQATAVALAWVLNHYKTGLNCASFDPNGIRGTCSEQCPTAMTVSSDGSLALSRLLNERYGNANAFGPPSGNSHHAWIGYVGCDPTGEGPFDP